MLRTRAVHDASRTGIKGRGCAWPRESERPLLTCNSPAMFCLLLLFLLAVSAYADHHDCQNAGGPGSLNGMTKWCTANAQRFKGKTTYSCEGPPLVKNKGSKQVADWNVLKPGYLEYGEDMRRLFRKRCLAIDTLLHGFYAILGTPCGHGGYGGLFVWPHNDEWYCPAHWVVATGGNYYWLYGNDDCESRTLHNTTSMLPFLIDLGRHE